MKSTFETLNPIVCFVYFTGVIMLSMLLLHPSFLIIGILIMIGINLLQKNAESMKKSLRSGLFLAILIVIINPLINRRGSHFLFFIGHNPVTLESVVYGITISLSFLLIMLTFTSYNKVITSHKFLYLFAGISPKLALLTLITIRFVPLFLRRLHQITLVQKTRGLTLENGSLRTRSKNGMRLIEILIVCCLEEALETAESMQARGFGVTKRSTYLTYIMTKRDLMWLLMTAFLGGICFIGGMQGIGVLDVFPILEVFFTTKDLYILLIFISYMSIPLVIEGREWLWWRISK